MLPLWELEGFSFVRCASCGLVQQNPQPEPASVLSRYDASYLEYEEKEQFGYRDLELATLADLGFEEAARPLVLRAKEADRAPSLLDVGCATGALLEHFSRQGWACTGVEACAPAAAYGRERFGLDIRPTTLEAARLPAASFEVVHASHLIEHLNDPAAFLAEALRLLAPGGLLLLTTPNVDGFQAKLSGAEWRSAIYDHLYLFSKRTLSALLAEAGFDILATMSWGGWPRGRKPAFLKVPLDRAAKRLDRGDVMAFMARPAGTGPANPGEGGPDA
jgi:2-polyprenyl-3-methyl-5-hydroxy-6-metoxy-1,4-benzoquinol methylase